MLIIIAVVCWSMFLNSWDFHPTPKTMEFKEQPNISGKLFSNDMSAIGFKRIDLIKTTINNGYGFNLTFDRKPFQVDGVAIVALSHTKASRDIIGPKMNIMLGGRPTVLHYFMIKLTYRFRLD